MILYFYVNQNAVIIGTNQNPWKECDMAAMEADNVQLVRRITGGGAVYHDSGNLNFSFIAGKDRYDLDKQLQLILHAIRSLGIPCEFSGRNDLLADGKKFSGNAFCSRGQIRQHHGTLLIKSDLSRLQQYLQVDPKKLQAKGVSSVRSRVCNLSEFIEELSVPVVHRSLKKAFRKSYGDYTEWSSTPQQRAEIEVYREKHASWDWQIGKTPQFDIEIENRFDWGSLQLLLTLQQGKVHCAQVFTDAIDVDIAKEIQSLLQDCVFSSKELSAALNASEKTELTQLAQYILEQNL